MKMIEFEGTVYIEPERALAKLKAKLAKHEAKEKARRDKIEAARANPMTRFSNASRWRPPSLVWDAEWLRLTNEIERFSKVCGVMA